MSIKTSICGIEMDSCIMNASGCLCTTKEELDNLQNSSSGAIVSKSGTIYSRIGNPNPRLHVDNFGSINAMGLPNLGYEFYMDYGKNTTKPYIQSIHPFSINDLDIMLKDLDSIQTKRLIEINITCPNLVSGGNDNSFESFEKYMDRIKQHKLNHIVCGLKLSPFYEPNHFDIMTNLLLKYDVNFISCINSIPNGLIIDPENETTQIFPKNGLGGIGGNFIKPTALANVYNFSKRLNGQIDIIGCGGINNGDDVFEHILCGAKAVQVGTELIRSGVKCFDKLNNELSDIMNKKNYDKLNDFYGKLKVINEFV